MADSSSWTRNATCWRQRQEESRDDCDERGSPTDGRDAAVSSVAKSRDPDVVVVVVVVGMLPLEWPGCLLGEGSAGLAGLVTICGNEDDVGWLVSVDIHGGENIILSHGDFDLGTQSPSQ